MSSSKKEGNFDVIGNRLLAGFIVKGSY